MDKSFADQIIDVWSENNELKAQMQEMSSKLELVGQQFLDLLEQNADLSTIVAQIQETLTSQNKLVELLTGQVSADKAQFRNQLALLEDVRKGRDDLLTQLEKIHERNADAAN